MTTYNPASTTPFWSYDEDLKLLTIAIILMGISVYLTPLAPLKVLLGAAYCLFMPGYTLMSALYSDKSSINIVQRFSASVGFSLVVTGLIGLVVAYTIGVSSKTIYLGLTSWFALMMPITKYRRSLLLPSDQFAPMVNTEMHSWRQRCWPRSLASMAQSLAILVMILAGARLLWIASSTQPQFSEFYLLDQNGEMGEYPQFNRSTNSVSVIIGVKNHEKETSSYNIQYRIGNNERQPINNFELHDAEKMESNVTLPIPLKSHHQKITFELYKDNTLSPYHTLYIWLDPLSS